MVTMNKRRNWLTIIVLAVLPCCSVCVATNKNRHRPSIKQLKPLHASTIPSSSDRSRGRSTNNQNTNRHVVSYPAPFTVRNVRKFSSTATKVSSTSFEGRPSFPGWNRRKLKKLTDWAVNDQANRPIICEYEPEGIWLWTRWRGTVLAMTFMPVMFIMSLTGTLDFTIHSIAEPWPFLALPPAEDPIIQQLQGINNLWEYLLTLCTFILTFFTSEAYKHWKSVYFTTRAIQGRINDICLLITIAAQRGDCTTQRGREMTNNRKMNAKNQGISGYSQSAATIVKQCTRLIKLSHTFFWAATPTCSNGVVDNIDGEVINSVDDNAIGPLLLSEDGLQRLVRANELTQEEKDALVDSGLPQSQYCYVLLEWVGLIVMDGVRSGAFSDTINKDDKATDTYNNDESQNNDSKAAYYERLNHDISIGFQENILRQITQLRAEYFNIGDFAAGRMPLAYVQLVQVLVDSLVILSPLALYPELGSLSIPLTGLLTLFYKGLLELSKSFLDPFGNEGYPTQNIRVDVLVSELNFGAGSRWVKAGESLPAYSSKLEE